MIRRHDLVRYKIIHVSSRISKITFWLVQTIKTKVSARRWTFGFLWPIHFFSALTISIDWRHLLKVNQLKLPRNSLTVNRLGIAHNCFYFPFVNLSAIREFDPCLAFSHLLQVLPLHTSYTNQMSHNSLVVSYQTGVATFFTWARFFSFLRLARQCFHLAPFLESVIARRFLPTPVFSLLLA